MAESHVTIWKNKPADAGLDTVKKISRGKVNIRLTGVITRQDLISVGHIRCPGLNYPSPPPSFHLSDSPVSCSAHHGLPFCLEPTEWDSSAYSGGFFALTNFLGQSSAERRTDVYVLTFTAPVDGQTGRMGETLCLLPPIFSFSQLFTKMSTPFPGQYLICSWDLYHQWYHQHFSQLYLVVQHWEEHGFDCTLQRVYNRIFTFFREERGSTQLAVTFMYWHLSLPSAIHC